MTDQHSFPATARAVTRTNSSVLSPIFSCSAGGKKVGRRTLRKSLALLACMMLLTSCVNSITVEGSSPTPLVKKIPARIGIYYSDTFKTFRHDEKIEQNGTWQIEFGAQNLTFFRNLTAAMFTNVVEVSKSPVDATMLPGLDGVLVPEIKKFGFLTPSVSGLNFFSASIQYRMTLYNAERQKISEWTVVGYGKSEASAFGSKEALNEATMLAIRDGGARIAVELGDQPGIDAWVQSLNPESAEAVTELEI
jgi:hypothetical protein